MNCYLVQDAHDEWLVTVVDDSPLVTALLELGRGPDLKLAQTLSRFWLFSYKISLIGLHLSLIASWIHDVSVSPANVTSIQSITLANRRNEVSELCLRINCLTHFSLLYTRVCTIIVHFSPPTCCSGAKLTHCQWLTLLLASEPILGSLSLSSRSFALSFESRALTLGVLLGYPSPTWCQTICDLQTHPSSFLCKFRGRREKLEQHFDTIFVPGTVQTRQRRRALFLLLVSFEQRKMKIYGNLNGFQSQFRFALMNSVTRSRSEASNIRRCLHQNFPKMVFVAVLSMTSFKWKAGLQLPSKFLGEMWYEGMGNFFPHNRPPSGYIECGPRGRATCCWHVYLLIGSLCSKSW